MGKTQGPGPQWRQGTGLRGEACPDRLTPREEQVMTILAQGYQQKEIARMLGISFHTVHDHLQVIYTKLQVESAARAVIAWRERGEGKSSAQDDRPVE